MLDQTELTMKPEPPEENLIELLENLIVPSAVSPRRREPVLICHVNWINQHTLPCRRLSGFERGDSETHVPFPVFPALSFIPAGTHFAWSSYGARNLPIRRVILADSPISLATFST